MIIAAFPGTGKSTLLEKMKESGYEIHDSDSSKFSWVEKGVRNPEFPKNYIEHLKSVDGPNSIVLCSTHKEVREALLAEGMQFTIVHPISSCKEEYLERYRKRGSPESFVKLLDEKWTEWNLELAQTEGVPRLLMRPGDFLTDVVETILQLNKPIVPA